MKFDISTESAAFLHLALNNVSGLYPERFGLKPYSSQNTREGKQVHMIKKWFKRKVLVKIGDKDKNAQYRLPDSTVRVGLAQSYVEVLKSIVSYYQVIGLTTDWCEAYCPLLSSLSGDKYIEEDPSDDTQEPDIAK